MSQRTVETLARVAREGRCRSRFTPFGWRLPDGRTQQRKGERELLVEHAAEQRVLARIRELREGGKGARKIARTLGAEGIENPRSGVDWKPENVASLLRTMERRDEAMSAV